MKPPPVLGNAFGIVPFGCVAAVDVEGCGFKGGVEAGGVEGCGFEGGVEAGGVDAGGVEAGGVEAGGVDDVVEPVPFDVPPGFNPPEPPVFSPDAPGGVMSSALTLVKTAEIDRMIATVKKTAAIRRRILGVPPILTFLHLDRARMPHRY